MTVLHADQLQTLRSRLQQRQQDLSEELRSVQDERVGAMEAAQRDTVQDAGELGEQRSRDEVRRGEQERDARELRDIAAALQRMDEGHYGQCSDCGSAIARTRLQVQPAALRCIKCQERFEGGPPAGAGTLRP